MIPTHWKDWTLYFMTANVCFFISLNMENEKTLAFLGIMLFMLLFAFMMRIEDNEINNSF